MAAGKGGTGGPQPPPPGLQVRKKPGLSGTLREQDSSAELQLLWLVANGRWQGAGGLADGVPWAGSAATTINRADSERPSKPKAEPRSVEETAWSGAGVGVWCWGAQRHVLDANTAPVGLWHSQDTR